MAPLGLTLPVIVKKTRDGHLLGGNSERESWWALVARTGEHDVRLEFEFNKPFDITEHIAARVTPGQAWTEKTRSDKNQERMVRQMI